MENKKVPQLRFNGFDDEWTIKTLSDISNKVTTKNSKREFSETFTNSAEFGIISQRDYFDNDISNNDNIDGYYVVENDDFVYNPRISVTAPVGPINRNKLCRTGVMSPLYYVFRTKNVDNTFLEKYFKSESWHPFMFLNGDSGARSDRFSIKDNVFNQMPISMPKSESEQQKIGAFLSNIDSLIQAKTQKLETLKTVKKSLLQKCFPKDGEKVPQMRFEGFSGEWEEKLLNEYLYPSREKNKNDKFTKNDVLSVSREFGIVNQIEFQGRSFAGASVANYGVVEEGDIVYTKSPLSVAPYGIIKSNQYKSGIVSTLYAVYKVNDNIDALFVEKYFDDESRLNEYLRPLVRKGAKNDMKVSSEDALKGLVRFPTSKEEQQKIGQFFSKYDSLISLQQKEIDNLKTIKKSLLQKMFI